MIIKRDKLCERAVQITGCFENGSYSRLQRLSSLDVFSPHIVNILKNSAVMNHEGRNKKGKYFTLKYHLNCYN